MPIQVKTMRDIWDAKRVEEKLKKEMMKGRRTIISKRISPEYLNYLKVKEKSLAEMRKHLLDYLERKKYSTEIFGFIEKDLGGAGFSLKKVRPSSSPPQADTTE